MFDNQMSRNYDVKPTKEKATLKCPICNKKYKSEKKRQEHVEKSHYYSTRNSNLVCFDHELRSKIYTLADNYLSLLCQLENLGRDEILCDPKMLQSCKNLLPQEHGKNITLEEALRMSTAQQTLAKRFFNENLLRCNWEDVMNDLEKFFQMGLPYYDTNFCPSLPIDFLWHSLMQDYDLYSKICQESCHEIMPHCAIERTESEDQKRHEYFVEVFQHKFGRTPHVPTQETENKNIFADLAKKEIRNRDEKEAKKIREKEEKEAKKIQEMEKYRREEEARVKIMTEFSEKVGIEISSWYDYEICFEAYKQGHRGQHLKNYYIDIINSRRSLLLASSC